MNHSRTLSALCLLLAALLCATGCPIEPLPHEEAPVDDVQDSDPSSDPVTTLAHHDASGHDSAS